MKKFIYCTLAILAMMASASCHKEEPANVVPVPKDAKGQWLVDISDAIMMVDVRHTFDDSFVIARREPKEGYDPSTEETPSKDPYDPNYRWIYAPNSAIKSSDKTTEGEWTVINSDLYTIKYSITSKDVMICKLLDGTSEMIVVCTRIDPEIELTATDDK